jgi:murein DD-endopeptidase MepM/ murein hydrolase activator NlpD
VTRHGRTRRAKRRLAAGLVAGVLTVGLATAGSGAPSAADRKADVDQRLQRAEARLVRARDQEAVLSSEVSAYTGRIRRIERRLVPLETRSNRLGNELAVLEGRLADLTGRLDAERANLARARARLVTQREVLGTRLRAMYRRDDPDPLLVLLESGSIAGAVAAVDQIERAADLDKEAIASVEDYAREVREARDRLADLRAGVQRSERRVKAAALRARGAARALRAERDDLGRFRDGRQRLLSRVRGDREDLEVETRGLRERSLRLGREIARIQGVSGASIDITPSQAGLVWPVNGPLTSPFGMRWGRMHEGIDVGVGEGTPISAAKAGTVIMAGWGGGYGNLVVIDHGGGLSTAYAHQSRIAVAVGQQVGQGSVIGYVGNTGHSFGAHLHFEVRVNGSATDPLAYL